VQAVLQVYQAHLALAVVKLLARLVHQVNLE
jgi:hypothetical protein